ncbi:MAG: uridine diphosphate-N-acetylglucosamine-binding protein YvcK [Caldiserica bacterium]|nr:uridine diphosphate-N-acetylglucosamine-binding protein YvcK [Caldisericota bacterium]MDH7562735.1 YvcK family protein [Caldisericota bacterium]
MRVKRWLLLMGLGLLLLVCAVVLYFLDWMVLLRIKTALSYFFAQLPFSPLSEPWREIIATVLLLFSAGLIILGLSKLIESLVTVILPEHPERLSEIVFEKRRGKKGFKIIALGGGTGLSTLLRGLKLLPCEPLAVVTVADDGGSSGRLRKELGILPPGDIRNCLVALSDTEPLMEELFQYRFQKGESLGGHNFGNIFIAALTEVTGDFGRAVVAASDVLRVKGQALPFTLDDVTLEAEFFDGTREEGETKIRGAGKKIKKLFLKPQNTRPLPGLIDQIRQADVILIGPGSLFTSIIPPFLQKEVSEAVREANCPRIFISNIMTEHGETDGFSVSDHLKILFEHAGGRVCDYCVISTTPISPDVLERYRMEEAEPVKIDLPQVRSLGVQPVLADLTRSDSVLRHDPEKLARVLWKIILQRKREKGR